MFQLHVVVHSEQGVFRHGGDTETVCSASWDMQEHVHVLVLRPAGSLAAPSRGAGHRFLQSSLPHGVVLVLVLPEHLQLQLGLRAHGLKVQTHYITDSITLIMKLCWDVKDWVKHLQVFGDGVVGTMGDNEDAVGLADQTMAHLDLPGVPVGDTCPHDGHAQLGIVGVVQFPV